MKKVGIITQHRVTNWGSFLQAYATQTFIERSLQCDCEVIDYVYPNAFQLQHQRKDTSIVSTLITLASKFSFTNTARKQKRLGIAIKECLSLSRQYPSFESLQSASPVYDLYITGSDQTLNPKFTYGDSNFMFSWVKDNSAKILSFAASMPSLKFSAEYEGIYRKWLSRYKALSVREDSCVEYLRELAGVPVVAHMDPTLLLTKDEWIEGLSKLKRYRRVKGDYILLYIINHTFDARPYIFELTKRLQEKTGLKVVTFSSIPKSFGIKNITVKDVGPRDFVELFAEASYVVTSSFHGTAFASNFGVPLYSILPQDYRKIDNRQFGLLSTLGNVNCLVPMSTNFNEIYPFYDSTSVREKIVHKKQEIVEWLLKNA